MRFAPRRLAFDIVGLPLFIALAVLMASIPGESADPGPGAHDVDGLRVEFMLPVGNVREVLTVDVLFNRPMRPLGRETRGDEASLVRIDPPVPGRFMWVGTRALRFLPDRPLPRATLFRGTVPAGVVDAEGKALAAAAEWTFSTEPPAVVAMHPPPGSHHLEPNGPIALVFNQPVDLTRLCQAVALTAGGRWTAATCAHPDSAALAALPPLPAASLDEIVFLQPKATLPPATPVEVQIAAAPLAAEGALPLPAPFTAQLATYGPLALIRGDADEFGLMLELSNPVEPESLAAHLSLSGPACTDTSRVQAYGRGARTHVHLGTRLRPGQGLRVEVRSGLKDRFGQALAVTSGLYLVTQDIAPAIEILPENAVLETKAARRVAVVRAVNVQRVTVRTAALTPEQAALITRRPWAMGSGEFDPFAGTRPSERTHRLTAGRNERSRITIELDELVPRGAGGFVLVRAASPDRFPNPATGVPDSLPARYSLIQITDLGLVAKVSASDIVVWATSLHTGEPLADVELEVFDTSGVTLWRGRTAGDGIARGATPAPWNRAGGWTLLGRRGRDRTILGVDTDWELSPWSFGLPGDYASAPRRAEGFLFTDRELYRPGETVHVKGIVRGRDHTGLGPAPLDSLVLKVMNPYGDAIHEQRIGLSVFGGFSTDLALTAAAPLGTYWANIDPIGVVPGELELRGSFGFRIEAFRPAPFQVDVTLAGPRGPGAAGQPLRLVRGDSLTARVTARTYFDSPLADSPVSLAIRREQTFVSPPAAADTLAGYAFTDLSREETRWELLTTTSTTIDSRGEAQLSAELAIPDVATPQSIEVEVQALDTGGRAVAAHAAADWYPADLLLGVRATPTLGAAGKPIEVAVVAASLAGAPLPGTAVRVDWVSQSWHTVMRQMVGGRLGYDSELVETVVDSAVVTTAASFGAPATARFVPARAGSYIARARAADRAGRETRSADFVYVSGPGFVPWSRETGHRLTLIADRAAYSAGDTATILIQSPFPTARGLLTVEREGISAVVPFTAQSTTPTLRIPLGEDAVPNVFASVVLVRGTAPPPGTTPGDTLWPQTPELRIGYVTLPVRPDGRRLNVRVSTPEGAGPGDSVAVRIAVSSAATGSAADAEVTLMLVDEAVLRLLGTPTPDPFTFFYRPQGLGVLNAAKALSVVETPGEAEKGESPGGGGGDLGRFRRFFASTACYVPDLLTGPDGQVEARFRLPDNLTTFRAMAIACDRKDRVGSGHAQLTVTRPLVLDPLLPRLARVGDSFTAGAVLANRTDKKLRVRADLSVGGEALVTAGRTSATVTIEPGRSRRVSFPVRAARAGEAMLQLAATATKGGRNGKAPPRDAVAFPFRVEEPLLTVVDAHYGVISGSDSLAPVPIVVPADVDAARSSLVVQASTSLIAGIESALTYLMDYPHGCLEQHASRLIGLTVARDLAPRLILPHWDAARREAATAHTLNQIAALGHYDGGFRLWPEASRSDPYLSAYTLLALIEARDAGIAVDGERLRDLARYLKQAFDAKRPAPPEPTPPKPAKSRRGKAPAASQPPVRATVTGPPFSTADALTAALLAREARNERSPLRELLRPSDLERLHANRGDLDTDGLLLLAAALNLASRFDARVGQIVNEVMNDVSMTGGRASLAGSAGRFTGDETQTALALRVLLAAWPDHPLAEPFARRLATERPRGRWRSTHATALAVLALRDLARLEGESGLVEGESGLEPVRVRGSLGTTLLFDRPVGGGGTGATFRVTWPLANLEGLVPGASATLDLARALPPGGDAGAPPFYHSVVLESARPALTLAAADAGLVVLRAAYPFDPLLPRAQVLPAARVTTGDVVRIEVTVVVPRAATDLALEDPLPAGLEPLILDLETVARSLGRGLMTRQWDDEDRSGMIDSYAETGGVLPVLHVERRDDRVAAFAPSVPAGIYRFEYLARAATPGEFAAPPAEAELMYDPEVRGRSAPLRLSVAAGKEEEKR